MKVNTLPNLIIENNKTKEYVEKKVLTWKSYSHITNIDRCVNVYLHKYTESHKPVI